MNLPSVRDIVHENELTWDWSDRCHSDSECLELAGFKNFRIGNTENVDSLQ